jgi:hypothetical protein
MAIVNITVENDADFSRVFQYMTSDGFPVNMVGVTLEMMLRRHATDALAVLRLSTENGDFKLLDPLQGIFSLFISQDTLEHLELGDFEHSNIMTSDTGLKTRIWSGTFTNNAGATR